MAQSGCYFYVTQNVNCDEPEKLKATEGYRHVKAHTSGNQTVCLTTARYTGQDAIAVSFDEAQAVLDDWIDEENANPPIGPPVSVLDDQGQAVLDAEGRPVVRPGEPIIQQRISVANYVTDGGAP